MNKIEQFLNGYSLELSECHPDWIDIVQDYYSIMSALPDEVRSQKEDEIIKLFNNYHDITEEKPEPVKKTKKQVKKVQLVHEYDEKSLLDRADDFIKNM